MEELLFDVYNSLNICSSEEKCDTCPYKDVGDMSCIDALMLDTIVVLEEFMAATGITQEE